MVKRNKLGWLLLAFILAVISVPGTLQAASKAKPAIVLVAFGTSTKAFATYHHFEEKVKARFPDYDIRWAFTSVKIRHKLAQEKAQRLNVRAIIAKREKNITGMINLPPSSTEISMTIADT